ncbi:MAG: hypothetical protein ABID63_16185 [Pseudomonadota bacterium]
MFPAFGIVINLLILNYFFQMAKGMQSYFRFFEKVLDLFFLLWHKRKINGANAPGPDPQGTMPCGFLRLAPDERDDDAAVQRQTDRKARLPDRRMEESLRGHSNTALTRPQVKTPEVRLVGRPCAPMLPGVIRHCQGGESG